MPIPHNDSGDTKRMTTPSRPDPHATLDPEIAEFVRRSVEALSAFPPKEALAPAHARKMVEQARRQWFEGGPEMASVQDVDVSTRHGPVRVRVYVPKSVSSDAGFVYLPGGGWTLFSVVTHDRLMREYAEQAQMVVFGVDYSRSPEAKFPQAIHEIDDVIDWLQENAGTFGVDGARLALGGDSAGGNLTAAVCLARRDAGKPLPAGCVYNYGVFNLDLFKPSMVRYGGGDYLLTAYAMLWYTTNYIRSNDDLQHPWANPVLADKTGLPPAFMVITDHDVLYDDSVAWAQGLKQAGVPVDDRTYPGTVHSFLEASSLCRVSRQAIDDTADWLKTNLVRGAHRLRAGRPLCRKPGL